MRCLHKMGCFVNVCRMRGRYRLIVFLQSSLQRFLEHRVLCSRSPGSQARVCFPIGKLSQVGVLSMKSRFVLPALLVVGLFIAASAAQAEAGLFSFSHGCGCAPEPSCCAPEPSCCDPCGKKHGLFHHLKHKLRNCCKPMCCAPEPTCCEPEPTCCAPEPVCCEPEPTCCAPEPTCCDPCGHKRHGLFHHLKHKLRNCCKPMCCEPEPTCCAPEPTCCG